jgi:hypothetical protein
MHGAKTKIIQKDINKHTANCKTSKKYTKLTEINIKTRLQIRLIFKRRIKSHLPFAGIIRSSPLFSTLAG